MYFNSSEESNRFQKTVKGSELELTLGAFQVVSLLKKSLDAFKTDGHTDRVLCIENHPGRTVLIILLPSVTHKK